MRTQAAFDPCGAYVQAQIIRFKHDEIHLYLHVFKGLNTVLLLSIYKMITPIFSNFPSKSWLCCVYQPAAVAVLSSAFFQLLSQEISLRALIFFLCCFMISVTIIGANADEVPGALNKVYPLIF